VEDKNVSLFGLFQRIEELEKENSSLKTVNDDGKIYDSLSRENAKLRLQIAELKMKRD